SDYSSDSDSSRLFVSRTAFHSSARRSISDLGTEITRLTNFRKRSNDFGSVVSDFSIFHVGGFIPTWIYTTSGSLPNAFRPSAWMPTFSKPRWMGPACGDTLSLSDEKSCVCSQPLPASQYNRRSPWKDRQRD